MHYAGKGGVRVHIYKHYAGRELNNTSTVHNVLLEFLDYIHLVMAFGLSISQIATALLSMGPAIYIEVSQICWHQSSNFSCLPTEYACAPMKPYFKQYRPTSCLAILGFKGKAMAD